MADLQAEIQAAVARIDRLIAEKDEKEEYR